MYQRILVPVDGSSTSNLGLDEAIKLAKLTGARLRLVHAVEPLLYAPGLSADTLLLDRQQGEKILGACKARVEAAGVPVETHLVETHAISVADMAAADARAWGADLVVLGTHGRRGMRRLMLGSDAEQVIRRSAVPVLLVRGNGETPALEV